MAEDICHQGPSIPLIDRAPFTVRVPRKSSHARRPRCSHSKAPGYRTSRDQFSGTRSSASVRIQEIWRDAELCQPISETLLPQFHSRLFRRVEPKPRLRQLQPVSAAKISTRYKAGDCHPSRTTRENAPGNLGIADDCCAEDFVMRVPGTTKAWQGKGCQDPRRLR